MFTQIAKLTLLVAAFCACAQADWSVASRQWERDFLSGPVLFPNPHMAEVWTDARDLDVRDAHIYSETIEDSRFAKGSFKVALQTKKSWFHPEKAPLMLYLPGLFSNMEDHEAMRAAAFYSERGYHVVIPSNPWSEEFLKHQPKFDPGTLDIEAEVALTALEYAIQKIGPNNISRVEISGESYGAMLAAIAYVKDRQSSHPLIDGNATLFSPPLEMATAIVNLDSGIDTFQSQFDSCSSVSTLLKISDECEAHTSQDALSQEVVQCAAPLVYSGFHNGLVGSVKLLHSFRPTGSIPTDKAALAQWAAQLRFSSLLSQYLPHSQALLNSGMGNLLYWLGQLDSNSIRNVRIFSAEDDFLNIGLSWTTDGSVLWDENLMLIPWGGHAGYMELSSFQDLLNTAF